MKQHDPRALLLLLGKPNSTSVVTALFHVDSVLYILASTVFPLLSLRFSLNQGNLIQRIKLGELFPLKARKMKR